MEDESPKKRNIRPTEKSNLPIITLFVLVLLVLAMLYVGYEYVSDDSTNSEELTSTVKDAPEEKTVAEEPATEETESEDPVIKEKPKAAEEKDKEKTKEKEKEKKEEPKKTEDAKVVASRIGGKEITRTVKGGETFSSLASRYNLTTETLKSLNPSITELKSGDKLKIRVKAVHTVGAGDILKVVSGKYDVSKEAIMKANGKTKDLASRGEELVIPFPTKR